MKKEKIKLYEMSYIWGAELFLDGIKDFDEKSISSLDTKKKENFKKFLINVKKRYPGMTFLEILEFEKTNESSKEDWDGFDLDDQRKIKILSISLDSNPEYLV
jgi:hypothetical protein